MNSDDLALSATPTTAPPKSESKTSETETKSPIDKEPSDKKLKAAPEKPKKSRKTKQKVFIIIAVLIIIGLIAGLSFIFYQLTHAPASQTQTERVEFPEPIYSVLTGLEITDESLNQSPTYCIQIPNGKDGARPQVGLRQAAVVFEAIAERGITRFAAIFQNTDTSAIGPIRSLRPYYLDWDTPFDCTVVHAGGSDEAIRAINAGGQRNLDESNEYMWREYYSGRSWNNLFTSSQDLASFNNSRGYTTSNISAFPRLTPEDTLAKTEELQQCPEDSPECIIEYVSPSINFGAAPAYNTVYAYNPETNTYARSYANGEPHLVYDCPTGLTRPNTTTECGELQQVTPSVVITMLVREGLMSDNYHENIQTISSGNAVIFQNGTVIEGTWEKRSQNAQIIFRDNAGEQISFTPGQLWLAAVPQYGSVNY